jgi:trans-aconitate 2-methyltransferase
MLAQAASHCGGGLSFELASIADFAGMPSTSATLDAHRSTATTSSNGKHASLPYTGNHDLIFSNAALQYVEQHSTLLAKLAARLNPGGQLAVQVPANDAHPAYMLAHSIAAEEPFSTALGGFIRRTPVLEPERYAELLPRLGFSEQSVRAQVYLHTLAEVGEVVEWVRGTLLNNYRQRLSAELYELYAALYRERLLDLIADERPYYFTFKRVLLWARMPG